MTAVEQRTWDPHEIPPAPDGFGSRFLVASSPAGWGSSPGATLGLVYRQLLVERQAEAVAIKPPSVGVKLAAVVEDRGEYRLVTRGVITGVAKWESRRPSKRWGRMRGESLDDFMLGGEAFSNAPDDEVWGAALELARAVCLRSSELRALNDTVALTLAARAGLDVRRDRLPAVIAA